MTDIFIMHIVNIQYKHHLSDLTNSYTVLNNLLMFCCKSAPYVLSRWVIHGKGCLKSNMKMWIVLISVGPAGSRFHLERYEHAKDRRLMGLMWSPESDGQNTSRLTVKPRKSLSFSQYRGITDTMLAYLFIYLFIYLGPSSWCLHSYASRWR